MDADELMERAWRVYTLSTEDEVTIPKLFQEGFRIGFIFRAERDRGYLGR